MLNSIPTFFDFTRPELSAYLEQKGYKPFLAQQLFQWVYQKNSLEFTHYSNIKKTTQAALPELVSLQLPKILLRRQSTDGTTKYLLQLSDGRTIETVVIPSAKRVTVCLSTQVGCKMACAFCVTGKMGFVRNLKVGEIVGQLAVLPEVLSITNLVFMGEGEPLDNIENVIKSIDIFQDPFGFNISHHRITLSTSGLVPKLVEFTKRSKVNLAISLHAVDDQMRDQLMPVNKAYNMDVLLKALSEIPLQHRKRITFEYIVIGDLNDRPEHALKLLRLLNGIRAKVNLIPYHANPYAPFKTPAQHDLLKFQEILMNKGLQTNIRQSRGLDIEAACGLLISRYEEEKNSQVFAPQLKRPSTKEVALS